MVGGAQGLLLAYLEYRITAEPLTEAEEAEKEQLATQGFDSWNKKHYQAFIRGCEQYGKTNYEGIHNELPEKSVEDIAAYGAVFWQRYKEIEGELERWPRLEISDSSLQTGNVNWQRLKRLRTSAAKTPTSTNS
jgi:hypothetical protein